MAEFVLSAFSDEYSPDFDCQLEGLRQNGIRQMEIRGVNGKNIGDLTVDEAKELKERLDAAGISVSALGSPIGKISVLEPIEDHLEKVKRAVYNASVFGTDRIRMFSFYIPKGEDPAIYREAVMERLGAMLAQTEKTNIMLCHENESGIYGDTPERCLDIMNSFAGKIKCVFDPANFAQCGAEPYPYAYKLLKEHIAYFHIKDCKADGEVVPSGQGICGISEILADAAEGLGRYTLSVEPHLRIFRGLDKLTENPEDVIKNRFFSSEEAFGAAVTALRGVMPPSKQR